MKGIEFEGQTKVMGKPSNMTDKECYGLPVQETVNGNYFGELTDEELKTVIESKRIRLGIVGTGMPPVYILAEPK